MKLENIILFTNTFVICSFRIKSSSELFKVYTPSLFRQTITYKNHYLHYILLYTTKQHDFDLAYLKVKVKSVGGTTAW